ncbi:MAG TPA: FAD:protein FMN transferase [Isosphaeraceae bacterium]|jgi:thiamine biosynthesis lipoprotein|nr:FAD:protein FMN transferase [Isosphaeraceae bacterium]
MRIHLRWLLPLWLWGVAQAGEPGLRRFEFVETHMGSPFKVVLYTTDEAAARRASQAAYARIAALDQALSDYNPESELMRLCDQAGGPPVKVSDDLFTVLERAQDISRRSEGAFDVTVGPVVRLWRRARRTRELPDPETLKHALSLVGYQNVKLDPQSHTVQLLKPGMKLDLGGIAKGYASGAAIAELKRLGIDRALVAGEGDIVVSGPPPEAEGWTIGIAPLEAPGTTAPSRYLLLHDAAVSTSGDAERFVEIKGKRYSHIVDPHTGVGLTERISVTVVAPDGATADVLDTTVCVLGPEKGLRLIESIPGAAALIVRGTGPDQTTIESPRWKGLHEVRKP